MLTRRGDHLARRLCGAALAGVIVAACGGAGAETVDDSAESPATTQIERAAPTTANGPPTLLANTVTGSQIDVSGLVGQDALLWFWAPW